MELFERAADQGYPPAMCNLGLCYELGEGKEKDPLPPPSGTSRRASGLPAPSNPGHCYLTGIGVERDSAQAAQWLTRGNQDFPRALSLLGNCYRDGEGVELDEARAVELYPSARQSYPPACAVWDSPTRWDRSDWDGRRGSGIPAPPSGAMPRPGQFGGVSTQRHRLQVDAKEAVKWLSGRRPELRGGEHSGLLLPGRRRRERDEARAVELYLRPGSWGRSQPYAAWACARIGYRRARGQEEGREDSHEAAEADETAQCNLGFCYLIGIGVEADPAKAALVQGVGGPGPRRASACWPTATGRQGHRLRTGHQLLPQIRGPGVRPAMCNLGLCYEAGRRREEDKPRALELYIQSGERGQHRSSVQREVLLPHRHRLRGGPGKGHPLVRAGGLGRLRPGPGPAGRLLPGQGRGPGQAGPWSSTIRPRPRATRTPPRA